MSTLLTSRTTYEPMSARSMLLPADAREVLAMASQAGDRKAPRGEDFVRMREIERARAWVMNKYPQFFRWLDSE